MSVSLSLLSDISGRSMLSIDNLSCARDSRLLFSDLSCQCNPGTITQIQGFNGAGKTTFLRTVVGLMRPEQGEILWQGTNIHDQKMLFNQQQLFLGHQTPIKDTLTPRENLEWLCQLNGCNTSTSFNQALSIVGLQGYENALSGSLSAGQKRRILLAQLYLTTARLWVLDEPFTAIDRMGVKALQDALIQHSEQGGIVLLTSHQALDLTPLSIINISDYQYCESLLGDNDE